MACTSFLFRNKPVFIIIVTAIFFSCSKTDEGEVPGGLKPIVPFKISVLAEKSEAIYQIDIFGNPEEKEAINLSQTIGVPADFREVHINGPKVTFFKKVGGYYAYWQKDLITGNSLSRIPLCEPVDGEVWSFAETNGEQLALITVTSSENNQWDSYLRVFNPTTDACSRFYISDTYVETGLQARLHKERLYLYTPEENIIEYSLTVINSNSGEQVKKLTFETAFQISMSEEKLYLLFSNGNYKVYRLNDLSLLEEGANGNPLLFKNAGIYETNFEGSKMVFDYPYAQPALFAYGPAIYDWETKEIIHGGDFYLADAINKLQAQYNQALAYTALNVNLDSNIIVAGYKVLGEAGKGGVIYFNFEGEIIYNFPLDYIPFKVIIRE